MLMKKISLKMTIITSIIVFILSMASTYAYLSYSVTNDVAIKGNIVNINATLNVELVSGTNTNMVPMMDNALNNAINGTGGTNKCIDSKGNLSCQVYKITLTNQGSTLKNLKGTIELYATNGGVYNNLKWQELSTSTSVKDGSSSNGMAKSTLVKKLTIKTKETKTWYIGIWISEIDADQRNTDKGRFGGTVTFGVPEGFVKTTLKKNAILDTNIDFSNISSDTNGKGIYIRSGTENDKNPIYYYRGAVDNNNVLFANFCWKIVRTTETGGIKLIYNGEPSNGTCNNTGTNSQIGTSAFNTSYNSPAYVGYMYGTVGASDYATTHANTNNSTIKTVLDNWYVSNIKDTTNEQYVVDAIYCNDREVQTSDSSYTGDGSGTNKTSYKARERLYTNKTPSLKCTQENDRFTINSKVSGVAGNGALTYSIGLITMDEALLSGIGLAFEEPDGTCPFIVNSNTYLSDGFNCWTMTQAVFVNNIAGAIIIQNDLIDPTNFAVGIDNIAVRPVISLKPDAITGGNGTMNNPFTVE